LTTLNPLGNTYSSHLVEFVPKQLCRPVWWAECCGAVGGGRPHRHVEARQHVAVQDRDMHTPVNNT